MAKITSESHVDHNLPPAVWDEVRRRIAPLQAFTILTIELPDGLTVPCALHGPATGGPPVAEADVRYERRGTRPGASRVVDRPALPSGKVTVIVGPASTPTAPGVKADTILYTAYAGPAAPREPFDPSLAPGAGLEESTAFWAQHALSAR